MEDKIGIEGKLDQYLFHSFPSRKDFDYFLLESEMKVESTFRFHLFIHLKKRGFPSYSPPYSFFILLFSTTLTGTKHRSPFRSISVFHIRHFLRGQKPLPLIPSPLFSVIYLWEGLRFCTLEDLHAPVRFRIGSIELSFEHHEMRPVA